MIKRSINAESVGAPPALGHYPHAMQLGELVYVSGQGAFAADGSGIVRGTLAEEMALTFSNISLILKAAGLTLKDVVKVLVFLNDLDEFAEFSELYKGYFPENPPVRSCIEAARLPGDMRVEIEVIALIPED